MFHPDKTMGLWKCVHAIELRAQRAKQFIFPKPGALSSAALLVANSSNLVNEPNNLPAYMIRMRILVAIEPGSQVYGLADIKHSAIRSLHEINPRHSRDALEEILPKTLEQRLGMLFE
jgi:hypothetical protein